MRYPAYPEYKDSGVQWLGRVPKHWVVKRGRFVMQVNPPAPLLRSLDEEDEVSFVPMDAVNEYGGIRLDQTRVKADVSGGYTEFQDGDVIIAKITPCFENGKGSLATGLLNSAAYGTTELHVLRVTKALDNRYLFYLTITDGYRKLGESEMYGAGGQKRVPPEFCKDFLTPLPTTPEQTAIADFLDGKTGRIDTLVAKKRRLVALLKEKRTALISRTVTRGLPGAAAREFGLEPHTRFRDSGIEWLGQVPEGWDIRRLRRISDRITVGVVVNPSGYVSDDGVPFLLGGDIREFQVDFFNSKRCSIQDSDGPLWKSRLSAGDLVVVRVGYPGVAAVVPPEMEGGNCASMMIVGRGERFNSQWLAYLFNSQVGRDQVEIVQYGAAQKQFNISHAVDFTFPFPPTREQSAIATYLDREIAKIDRLVEKVEAAIARLQEYRTALITATVTGKIDVREAVA